jgi:tryptophan 2,3-dioxygenase
VAALERHGISHHDLVAEAGRLDGPPPAVQLTGLATVQSRLHALDCAIMEWNQLHLRLVRSHLGGHPAARTGECAANGSADSAGAAPEAVSLRGAPISDLERLAEHALFPRLWRSVDETYRRIPRSAPPERS